jgi:hypothetical protein
VKPHVHQFCSSANSETLNALCEKHKVGELFDDVSSQPSPKEISPLPKTANETPPYPYMVPPPAQQNVSHGYRFDDEFCTQCGHMRRKLKPSFVVSVVTRENRLSFFFYATYCSIILNTIVIYLYSVNSYPI